MQKTALAGELAPPKKVTLAKLADYGIILFFLLMLFIPAIIMVATPDEKISLVENRPLAAAIDITTWVGKPVSQIVDEIENYVNDHFGLRNNITFLYGLLKFTLFNKSTTSQVVVGDNQWLFLSEGNMLNEYRKIGHLSSEYLDSAAQQLVTRREWLAQHGIQYYFMIIPEKQSIYTEYMPDEITILQRRSNLDQFLNYMEKNTDLDIIDIRKELTAAKANQVLYYQYDTHWNYAGAFIGYQSLMQTISRNFPEITALSPDQLISDVVTVTGDLANMIHLGSILIEDRPLLYVKDACAVQRNDIILEAIRDAYISAFTCERENDKAIIFHDSFLHAMQPFIVEHFNQTTFISTLTSFQSPYDQSYIEQLIDMGQAPDIVIEQMVERKLSLYFLSQNK